MSFSESVYEIFDPLTVVRRQHFWEWFDGQTINPRWRENNLGGTATFGMDDSIDGGFKIALNVNNGSSAIDFNLIRQYDHLGCIAGMVVRRTNSGSINVGFSDGDRMATANSFIGYEDNGSQTFKRLVMGDGTALLRTASTTPINELDTFAAVILEPPDGELFLEGVLAVSQTLRLPTAPMQPLIHNVGIAIELQELNIRYYEAFNGVTS